MTEDVLKIIDEAKKSTVKTTGSSSPLLDRCRKLAKEGDFVTLGNDVRQWINAFSISEKFIRARMPSIILNAYLAKQNILGFSDFLAWESEQKWATSIKESCDNGEELSSVINSIVQSMNEFKNA